jgi:hypothetical protein
MATVLQNGMTPAEQAREAFRELLTERPDFMDTSRYSINDVVPFLEQEDGFPKWLEYFENNMRALSVVWSNTAKQMKSPSAPSTQPTARVEATKPPQPAAEVRPRVVPPTVAPKPRPLNEAPLTPKVEATMEEKPKTVNETNQEAKPQTTVEPSAEAKPKVVAPKKPKESGQGVIESKTAIVPKDEIPPAVLEEQAIMQSKALAEQFAIVKHHEIALRQAAISIEEATEALNRARQSHANAITAYSNALEDLARMLASSLGTKTTEFTKLLTKVATTEQKK